MTIATDDLFDLFQTRLASVLGITHRVATSVDAARLIAEIGEGAGTIWASPVVQQQAPVLAAAIDAGGIAIRFDGDPTSVRDQPLGLTIARNAIAETGSCLLVEPTLTERAVSLMTQTLIVLCPTAGLLPRLDEAATVLREASLDQATYATLVTGPSRTADIERQLTVGVQGPAVFHVVFVDDLT
jgi:L-lactate dehydrogenase complex protein LldG